jgi:hypothetical protein
MVRSRLRVGLPLLALPLLVWGCSTTPYFVAKDEPWRDKEEQACLTSGVVRESNFVRTRSALGGPSVCGAVRPFEMTAAGGGRVLLEPAALLRCPMIPQVDQWVTNAVEPAARRYYGIPLAKLKIAASYSCRPMNNRFGAKLSEHGHANALDISGFVLADGTSITVRDGWFGAPRDRAFLHDVRNGACNGFTTVLSPDHDAHHRDHFHIDLARHGRDGLKGICK